MKLIDYIFGIGVRLQMRYLKKDVDDARFSMSLFIGVWLAFFLVGLLSIIGIIYPNHLISNIANSYAGYPITTIIVAALSAWRYMRFVEYDKLADSWKKMSDINQGLLILIFWIFILGVPIFLWMALRTYIY